jgi:hypothetical protein
MSVFANGREVSGKAQPNQVIAGFPSVCMSPPPPPAGPVPIPYPMFTQANRTTQGTTTVKIKRKEVGKKNASTYKDSKGNEPATRSFGMDVVSHTLSGASKHEAYSFDVKAQNSGVERFMDLTTTNHSNPATALTIDAASANPALAGGDENPCADLKKLSKDERDKMTSDKGKVISDIGNGKTTIASGQLTINGQKSVMKACSTDLSTTKLKGEGFASGITNDPETQKLRNEKQPVPSGVCGGHTYKHMGGGPLTSHAEARILEDIAKDHPETAGTGKTKVAKLVISINWQKVATDVDDKGNPTTLKSTLRYPCSNCWELICKAETCFDIVLCKEDNTPVLAKDVCNEKDAKKKKKMMRLE